MGDAAGVDVPPVWPEVDCVTDYQLVPEPLDECPPAPKLVYVALSIEGPSTASELEAKTRLPRRTVQKGLETLQDAGAVSASPNLEDGRKRTYRITRP